MEEPFIPEQGNDPPEVPDQRFPMRESFCQFGHVMVAQSPVTEIGVIENPVQDGSANQYPNRAEAKPTPAVRIGGGRHIIKVMVPDEKGDQCETSNLSRVNPEKTLHFRGAFCGFQMMKGFGRNPERDDLATEESDQIGGDK